MVIPDEVKLKLHLDEDPVPKQPRKRPKKTSAPTPNIVEFPELDDVSEAPGSKVGNSSYYI